MKNNISGYDGDAFAKLIEEMIQLASGCNAGTSTFSAVRPDGWTVEISVKAPKEKDVKRILRKDDAQTERPAPPENMEELLRRSAWDIRDGHDLGLPVRPRNRLKAASINDVGTLCSCTESDLMSLRNFGADCLVQVKRALENLGLGLGMNLEEYGYKRPDWLEEYK